MRHYQAMKALMIAFENLQSSIRQSKTHLNTFQPASLNNYLRYFSVYWVAYLILSIIGFGF
jgi:hypothetical protein